MWLIMYLLHQSAVKQKVNVIHLQLINYVHNIQDVQSDTSLVLIPHTCYLAKHPAAKLLLMHLKRRQCDDGETFQQLRLWVMR